MAAAPGGKVSKKEFAFYTHGLAELAPKDPVEVMLSLQMLTLHNQVMRFARRVGSADTIEGQERSIRATNSFARTFAAQTECFKRYRSGDKQHVTVKHVTVEDGGQAIVGNVSMAKPQP